MKKLTDDPTLKVWQTDVPSEHLGALADLYVRHRALPYSQAHLVAVIALESQLREYGYRVALHNAGIGQDFEELRQLYLAVEYSMRNYLESVGAVYPEEG